MMRLVCTEDGANKFWEASVEGAALTVRYGKVGTSGQTKVKTLASPAAAEKELKKLTAEKLAKGYVEEGETKAPATSASDVYPFLWYWHAPADWAEGANMGHAFELRFESPPAATVKAAIAAVVATADQGVLDGPDAFTWSGSWALFHVGEQPEVVRAAWSAEIERLLLAIHAVAPLAEVVRGNARYGGTSAWDAWTKERRAVPSPHPPFAGYERVENDSVAGDVAGDDAGSVDPAFEEARRAVAGAAARRATEAFVAASAEPKKDKTAKPELSLVAAPIPKAEPADANDVRTAAAHPDFVSSFRTPIFRWARGLVMAVESPGWKAIVFEEGKEPRELAFPRRGSLVVEPDATRAFIVGTNQPYVTDLDLETGEALPCVAPDFGPKWFPGGAGRLVVATATEELVVLARDSDEHLTALSRIPEPRGRVYATASGRFLVAAGKTELKAFSIDDAGKLLDLARVKTPGEGIDIVGDRVFVTARDGTTFEVTGLEEARAAKLAGRKGRDRAAKHAAQAKLAQRALAKGEPTFAPASDPPRAKTPTDFGDGVSAWSTPSGRPVAWVSEDGVTKLAWIDGGARRSVTVPEVTGSPTEAARTTRVTEAPDDTLWVDVWPAWRSHHVTPSTGEIASREKLSSLLGALVRTVPLAGGALLVVVHGGDSYLISSGGETKATPRFRERSMVTNAAGTILYAAGDEVVSVHRFDPATCSLERVRGLVLEAWQRASLSRVGEKIVADVDGYAYVLQNAEDIG